MVRPDSLVPWADLMPLAQRGDREARAALYTAFARTVHAIALAHVGAQHADDVTQEVFCSVFASLATLRDAAALPGFLCATARNKSRDVLRRHRRTPPAVAADDLTAGGPSPAVQAEQKEQAARVLACMQSLPDAYRETLALRLVAGLSGHEIAERTGLTHGSVRVNLTRGMALLRPLLQAAGLP
ncbi:MAG TPA: sigma-70 family RNA polymerase sigma factor [Planctomycetota bacterium]